MLLSPVKVLASSIWLELMAKKINPYPLFSVREASRMPPRRAKKLLDHFNPWISKAFESREGFDFEALLSVIFTTMDEDFQKELDRKDTK
jgi:hypothetical protein